MRVLSILLLAIGIATLIGCSDGPTPPRDCRIPLVDYIRDWDYERNKFFDLGILGTPEQVENGLADFAPGVDEILVFKLFVEETDINRYIVTPGIAYADPFRPDLHEDENRPTTWMELDKDE